MFPSVQTYALICESIQNGCIEICWDNFVDNQSFMYVNLRCIRLQLCFSFFLEFFPTYCSWIFFFSRWAIVHANNVIKVKRGVTEIKEICKFASGQLKNFSSFVCCNYILVLGAIASSADSLNHILSEGNGRAVGVVLGGAEEVLDTNPGSYDLNLSKRRGFIKIALRNG